MSTHRTVRCIRTRITSRPPLGPGEKGSSGRLPAERPRPTGAGGFAIDGEGGVWIEATCQVRGAAGSAGIVMTLAGGSIASGTGRFVASMSTASSSGDASRAREAARIELERLVFMVFNGKKKDRRITQSGSDRQLRYHENLLVAICCSRCFQPFYHQLWWWDTVQPF